MGAIFTTLTQTPVNKEEYGDTDSYSVEISVFTMIQMLEMQLCRDYSNVSSQESVFDDIFKIRISKLFTLIFLCETYYSIIDLSYVISYIFSIKIILQCYESLKCILP